MQVRFIEIHQVFAKTKVGYFSNRLRIVVYALCIPDEETLHARVIEAFETFQHYLEVFERL